MKTPAILLVVPLLAGFAAPQQPWSSPDGQVRLLRPLIARPSTSQAPLGSLMAAGWRLNWTGRADRPGRMAVRLVLPVTAANGQGRRMEVMQVGWSATPAALRTCLDWGLAGPNGRRRPDRTINGTRYAAWANGDAGMSQSIDATDLRAVVRGRCYAVERFSYGVAAADPDPTVTLPRAQGAAMLDAALASLRLGPGPALVAPHFVVPRGTRAL